MSEKTLPDVLKQYTELLNKRKQLSEAYAIQDEKILSVKAKMENWLLSQKEEIDFEDSFESLEEPYIFWKISKKTVETAIISYRSIRDSVSGTNGKAAEFESEQNKNKVVIGNWLLCEANKLGVDNFSKKGVGKAYKKLKTYANIVDWDNFLEWAAENKAGDAIQKRVNSSFVTKYYDMKLDEDKEKAELEKREPSGEYPPFLDVRSEYEMIVTRG